jgi:hypothetical protein
MSKITSKRVDALVFKQQTGINNTSLSFNYFGWGFIIQENFDIGTFKHFSENGIVERIRSMD